MSIKFKTLTTGPLYIEPKFRDGSTMFGLLLSNLSNESRDVDVTVYRAAFTGLNTPEAWTSLTTSHTIDAESVLNLGISISKDRPYYLFQIKFVKKDDNNGSKGGGGDDDKKKPEIRPALYLICSNLGDAIQDFPLVPTGDWVEEKE